MNDGATQLKGAPADDTTKQAAKPTEPDTDVVKLAPEYSTNPRDVIMDNLEKQIEDERIKDQKTYLEENAEDQGLLPAAPDQEPADPTADGAQTVKPMHPPADPVAPAALPADLETHPMVDFIVMHNGEPHMKAKVNGIDKLIPMTKVQAQVQKLDAAEITLEQATKLSTDLKTREKWVLQNEASLKTRISELALAPPQPLPDPGATEEEILAESKDIVSNLFRGDENTAAEKLAKVLRRSQVPAQPAAPPIDTTQIAKDAADIAVVTMTEAERNKDAIAGYKQFGIDYPELMADPVLYKMTDNWTDVVENEHPEFTPSQIILEAGKRTTDWLAKQKGEKPAGDPIPPEDPAVIDPNRQERKDNLVRIPTPALGAIAPPGETEEIPQTPAEVFAEIKESRGQPV